MARIVSCNNIKTFFIYFAGVFLILLAWWIQANFGKITPAQTYFTLKAGYAGIINSDQAYFDTFLYKCLFPALFFSLLLMIVENFSFFSPSPRLGKIVLIAGMVYVGWQISLLEAFISLFAHRKDYFAANYINPDKVKLELKNPKSLVLIYVESLENTYSETAIFKRNLLQKLTVPEANAVSFKKYIQMPGTQWTIAALVATQCGIPLNMVTVFGSNEQGEKLQHFLPGGVCLGDILARHGYKNIYMNGSAVSSCAVGRFFQDHHYTEIYGKYEWIKLGANAASMSNWGLYDDELFSRAKARLTGLVKSGQLFNLTILTVDTHGPEGFLSNSCRRRGYHDFTGIVECTANQVADFVEFIRAKGWLKQMNIVILGDHLAMQNPVYSRLESMPTRRTVFNRFISSREFKTNTDYIVHFDMLPTILDTLGFHFKDGRLALGYSGFSPAKSRRPADRIPDMDRNIGNYSPAYNELYYNS